MRPGWTSRRTGWQRLRQVWPVRFGSEVTTPDVRQGEHAECGLAALAIAMGGHGVHMKLETLRTMAGSTAFGSSLRTLSGLAKAVGFSVRIKRCEPEDLRGLGFPVICHMRFIHFVVVECLDATWVRLNDPLSGPQCMRRSEFDRAFTGFALSLSRASESDQSRPARLRTHTKNQPFRLGQALWERLKPIRFALLFACLPAALGGALLASGALLAGWASDLHAAGSRLSLLALALACLFTGIGLVCWAETLVTRSMDRVGEATWNGYFARLQTLPPQTFLMKETARFSRTLAAARAFVDAELIHAGLALPTIIGTVCVTPAAGTLACLLTWCVIGLDAGLICAWSSQRGSVLLRPGKSAYLPTTIPDAVFRSPEGWKIGGGDGPVFNRLAGEDARSTSEATAISAAITMFNLARLMVRLLLILLGVIVIRAKLEIGAIGIGGAVATIGDLTLIAHITWAFGPFVRLADLRHRLLMLADFDDLSASTAALEPGKPGPDDFGPIGVRFHELGWQPVVGLPFVLSSVSGEVAPGGSMGVTGPAGSGMSTFCRLIAGVLTPSSGTIIFGSLTTSRLPAGSILLLDQDYRVLPLTVRENLKLGRCVDDSRLWHALDIVGLSARIRARGGLGCILTDAGRTLSGGERTRMALAQALVRCPSVLIVDCLLDTVDIALAHRIIEDIRRMRITLVLASTRRETLAMMDTLMTLPTTFEGNIIEKNGPSSQSL